MRRTYRRRLSRKGKLLLFLVGFLWFIGWILGRLGPMVQAAAETAAARQVEEAVTAQFYPGMPGIEQIRIMLAFYSGMYLEHPEYVRYILQAEAALYNAGLTAELQDRPPGRFDRADTPLTKAIQAGLADGSVSSEADVEEIYYNAYDAILGTMQRQVMGSTLCTLDKRRRMEQLCTLFLKAFQGLI